MTGLIKLTAGNTKFLKKVSELSGQAVAACIQCGMCTGSCPMVYTSQMDITPREMMRFVQLGLEEALECKTIWVCLTCLTCTARCPRDLDIAKVAEALRQIKLRRGLDYLHTNELPEEERESLPQIALVSSLRKFTS